MKKSIAALLLSLWLLAGCQSPFLFFPGGTLSGEVIYTESFEFARDYKLLQLEMGDLSAYSVILRCTVIEGSLYIDAAPSRKWAKLLAGSKNVRVKFGEALYPAVAVEVDDPNIKSQFFASRTVYEIRPIVKP